MSSARSRSAGTCEVDDVEAVVEVLAEGAGRDGLLEVAVGRRDDAHVGAAACACRRRASTRALAARAAASPAARAAARRSRRGTACRPAASAKRPSFVAWAPVKAPRTWPKSSLSSSASGMAPQLTATNGLLARGLALVDRARDQLLAGAALAGDRARCSWCRRRDRPRDRRRRAREDRRPRHAMDRAVWGASSVAQRFWASRAVREARRQLLMMPRLRLVGSSKAPRLVSPLEVCSAANSPEWQRDG